MEAIDKAKERLNELGYDNVFYPFEDDFRQDRIVAYSHETKNRIEIYNNPYPLKFNEDTGKLMKFTQKEYNAVVEAKKALGWDSKINLPYLTGRSEGTYGIGYRDYSFYKPGLDMDRVQKVLKEVISELSFDEVCKMFREICYDQVCYYDNELKGHIYNNSEYTQKHIEDATFLQRKVSTAVDLYAQVITDKHTFNEDYLRERLGL